MLDDRRADNADRGIDQCIGDDVAARHRQAELRASPERSALSLIIVGVERIDGILRSRDEDGVVVGAADQQVLSKERLRIDLAINVASEQLPEPPGLKERRCQHRLREAGAGASVVVAVRQHVRASHFVQPPTGSRERRRGGWREADGGCLRSAVEPRVRGRPTRQSDNADVQLVDAPHSARGRRHISGRRQGHCAGVRSAGEPACALDIAKVTQLEHAGSDALRFPYSPAERLSEPRSKTDRAGRCSAIQPSRTGNVAERFEQEFRAVL